jgi:hypothetical protein
MSGKFSMKLEVVGRLLSVSPSQGALTSHCLFASSPASVYRAVSTGAANDADALLDLTGRRPARTRSEYWECLPSPERSVWPPEAIVTNGNVTFRW